MSKTHSTYEPTIAFPLLERLRHINKRHIAYIAKPNFIDRLLQWTVLWIFPHFVTPNSITIFRFLTVPVIIYFLFTGQFIVAGILFVISAFSDAIDGALARTRKMVTDWGILFDPLADKLLIGSVALILITKVVGPYMALTIVTLEILIVLSILTRFKKQVVPAKVVGKLKMICQSVGVSLLFLHLIVPHELTIISAIFILTLGIVFALLSLFVYRSI